MNNIGGAAMGSAGQMFGNSYGPPGSSAECERPTAGNHWFPTESAGYDGDGDAEDDDNEQGNVGDGEDGEGRDPKRRRIARACDMCRKKKIKCDGKAPKCSHCENYKTECIFTPQEKKRAPPKGAKYIEGLENRLGRMESLLKMSGLLAEEDGGRTDLGTLERRLQERQGSSSRSSGASPQIAPAPPSRPPPQQTSLHSTPQMAQTSPALANTATPEPPKDSKNPFKRDPKEVDALADQMCSLITNNVGETRYIGSSSGFSIFSPKGIQWVNEKTGDSSFQRMIATATADDKIGWDHWRPEVFNDLFSRRVFKPLPPRQECYALLKDFFENFNCMFPLFHEPTFMHLVDKHYSLDPYEGSGWWASLNVALAIAHRLRVMSNLVGQEEDDHAWGYLKNAMAVFTELTMRNTDLLSVQALLGMALFLQGTPNPQPSFFLVAAAIRLAHSIGLHKSGSGFNLNEVENEQRKRVFWIAYLLDKDICLRSGRPPAQDDDDMNVELPSEDPPDNVGNIPLAKEIDGKRTLNLFRLMCLFAQIQSRVYKQLYSVKASRQSDGELLNTIGELDAQLEEWKDSIPIDFRPEHEINAAHTPLILHVVVLHFAYYNCLTTIHRMSVHHGYWTSRLSDYAIMGLNARPLNPRVFMSAALCVNAARTSIGLIRYIPQGDYACVWLILYYPVSALVTLFANILQNPQDVRARGDLRLMNSVCSFLTMLERDTTEANGNVRRMLSVCSEFERIAKVVLDKAERDMKGRGKRKQAEREKEKDRRDGNSIAAGLDEGKTLEMMQVETQSAYRRPIQTPSLRHSMETSAQGSPASWGSSPAAGSTSGSNEAKRASRGMDTNGNDIAALQQQQQAMLPPQQQQQQQQLLQPNGQWNQQPGFTMPNNNFNPQTTQSSPQFTQPGLTDGSFNPTTTGFSPPMAGAMDLNNPFTGAPGAGQDMLGGTGSFQQPFVPQDLWQMPMTLEWDWAEGLGLGSFTPGGMFEGFMGEGMGDGGGMGGQAQ
ncbi:uncharacterized protein LTR77_002409 [Saxophila tyrrhenica]|uniref:Zn(2)-C6 fungal-type domain-containing protein n=1 Tax=Saxophila tyrrhenica TaxID=1690608 RepID=A0AAV9PLY4_9PEZI|nr:hypothetical protein LTR77_002409 [Saxophila tyrrhenica]